MADPFSEPRKHVSQEFSSNPTSWAAPPHNMASLTNPCVLFMTWGPAPGTDTVNMAVVIHGQPPCPCHPERAGAADQQNVTSPRKRRDEGSRLWQNARGPFTRTGTAPPRINAHL
ncbi:unnamed protein product [Pleuronectes platessa]|uniref:Uncharacterized protein n=1 Tax=Pleuronectes platessa TaxID=8262 RepID=A0A9N7W364_PLEPL|nr:unnamed protein product [Pleuronectes platessa]